MDSILDDDHDVPIVLLTTKTVRYCVLTVQKFAALALGNAKASAPEAALKNFSAIPQLGFAVGTRSLMQANLSSGYVGDHSRKTNADARVDGGLRSR